MNRYDDDALPSEGEGVGYGRPPVAHRFRPGASGNPAGRPKGSPTTQDLIAREAKRLVKLKTAEGIVAIPKSEAMVKKLFAKALEGDLAATRLILQFTAAPAGKGSADTGGEEPIDPFTIDDEALKRMLARFEGFSNKADPK